MGSARENVEKYGEIHCFFGRLYGWIMEIQHGRLKPKSVHLKASCKQPTLLSKPYKHRAAMSGAMCISYHHCDYLLRRKNAKFDTLMGRRKLKPLEPSCSMAIR